MRIERSEIEETGEYDLEGLFIRLGHAIDSVGAKRVVLDTLEALFSGLPDHAVLRAELRRLFRWLKERGMTAVITAERGTETLTRYGLEEYVADCVIVLDHRVDGPGLDAAPARRQVPRLAARHERVSVPDRRHRASWCCRSLRSGSTTTLRSSASRPASPSSTRCSTARVSIRDSSVLVSGSPGTGKSSIAARIAEAACAARRARPALLLRGVGRPARAQHALDRHRPGALDEEGAAADPRLAADAARARAASRSHVRRGARLRARVVVVDPISNLTMQADDVGPQADADAADRLPQAEPRHGDLHQPGQRRRRGARRDRSSASRR